MLSQLFIALSLLLSSALAAPLQSRSSCDSPSPKSCSPIFTPHIRRGIAADNDINFSWIGYNNADGSLKNLTLSDEYPLSADKLNITTDGWVISQLNGTNQYHFVVASKEESNDEADRPLAQCIAPDTNGTTIRSTVCESPLATWNVECTACSSETNGDYAFGKRCLVRSNEFKTCATFTSDKLIELRNCSTLADLPDSFSFDSPVSYTLEDIVGTQSWFF